MQIIHQIVTVADPSINDSLSYLSTSLVGAIESYVVLPASSCNHTMHNSSQSTLYYSACCTDPLFSTRKLTFSSNCRSRWTAVIYCCIMSIYVFRQHVWEVWTSVVYHMTALVTFSVKFWRQNHRLSVGDQIFRALRHDLSICHQFMPAIMLPRSNFNQQSFLQHIFPSTRSNVSHYVTVWWHFLRLESSIHRLSEW